jgi:uncharacterized membrane protein YedE/YeeE
MDRLLFLALGTAFGFVLFRCGATDYDTVQRMFLLRDFQLWGVIGTAVAVTAPGLRLLRRHGRTASGAALRVTPKPRNPGNWVGGAIFGAGWSITGMCPGPIFVNLGAGKLHALAALAGALAGAALLASLHPRIAPALRLPVAKP